MARWWLPLAMLVIATLLLGDTAREALRFDRAAIATGEFWRLASAHFVHLGSSHYLLNVAGLALVWYLVGTALRTLDWILGILLAIAMIDLGLWFLNPELAWYVGLSGVLHALLIAGVIASPPRAELLFVGVVLVAKVAWEQFSGPLPGSEASSGGPVIVDAHLYGVIAGILTGVAARIRVPKPASI